MILHHQILRELVEYDQKIPYEELEDYYSIDGWEVDVLGDSEVEGLPLHVMTYGDPSKPCVYMNGTVHGDEYPTTYGLLTFAELISNPEKFIPNPGFIYDFRERYSFCFIPVANPWGYINNTRNNANNVNINRDWGPFTQKETILLRDKYLDLGNVVMYVDCHDVGRAMDHQALGFNTGEHRSTQIGEQTIESLRVITGRRTSEYSGILAPTMGHNWMGNQSAPNGETILTFYTEAYRWDTDHEEVYFVVNTLYLLIKYFDIWSTERVLNPENDQ